MGEVAKIEKAEAPTVQVADGGAMALLRAGATPEQIEKLMILQERWEANQARKAFNEAVAQAKAEIKPIVRKQDAHNSKYADLAAIADAIDPILSKYGLGYRHRSAQAEKISVTCILFHKFGHSEETTLSGPADKTGSKNEIQAIGSTLTYLQRYSLILSLGLATAKDDDGKAASEGETISEAQADELKKLLEKTGGDIAKFCEFSKIEKLEDLPATQFEAAKVLINRTARQRAARKGQP
jgi:hypothetical protein